VGRPADSRGDRSAGSPSTQLAAKIGIGPGHVVHLLGAPPGWSVPELPHDVRIRRRTTAGAGGGADVAIAFCRSSADLERRGVPLARALGDASTLWIAWPRRAGGHESDLTDSLVRAILLPLGVVDVKVAALDADWSGLKFVRRRENRSPPAR